MIEINLMETSPSFALTVWVFKQMILYLQLPLFFPALKWSAKKC